MEQPRGDKVKRLEVSRDEVSELAEQLVAWRRDFHRHPEVAFEEERTSAVIKTYLEDQGLSVRRCAGFGLVGLLEGNPGAKTVALRADMDALPIKEEGGKDYLSLNPEAAHACGHDGHMAILMGAVKLLSRKKDKFSGRVVFLFQPAEERPPGGARKMIEEGALVGVDAIFGLHLWQPLATGSVGLVKGAMMANSDEFSIVVRGRGGHGSMPHTAVDSILAAAHLVVNVQSIVSRNVDPLKSCVVSFGKVNGGTAFNIIPGEVSLNGTVRSFDKAVQVLAERRLREVAEGTGKTFGASCTVEYSKGFPALVNQPEMADFVNGVAQRVLGEDRLKKIDPIMGGEDFAYYLQEIPGAFFFFGAGDGQEFPHHHPAFDLDEKALPQAALLMSNLALEYLQR